MNYKVLIPCAGTGSRLGSLTKNISKALITIYDKPAISYIIEKFPKRFFYFATQIRIEKVVSSVSSLSRLSNSRLFKVISKNSIHE